MLLLISLGMISPQTILSLNLEKLLADKISDAKCFAKCQEAATEEDRGQCFIICKIIQENPETDVCSLAEVCLGGCKVACGERDEDEMKTKFMSVALDGCKLSWAVEGDRTDVAFLVAGEDQGNMWNLVHNKLTSSEVYLTAQMAAKFVNIQIFVINGLQVTDTISLDISQNMCFENVPQPKEISIQTEEEEAISLTAIIVLSTVGSCLLLFIGIVIYFRTRSSTIWEPSYYYDIELSYAVEEISFSSTNAEAGDSFLTLENLVRPELDVSSDNIEPSDDYEDVQVDDLQYIDPFIC